MQDDASFEVIAIADRFAWGCHCTLQIDRAYTREEQKLGWDRLQAPKLLTRRIGLDAGDTVQATILMPGLNIGDRLSVEQVAGDAALWSDWA